MSHERSPILAQSRAAIRGALSLSRGRVGEGFEVGVYDIGPNLLEDFLALARGQPFEQLPRHLLEGPVSNDARPTR